MLEEAVGLGEVPGVVTLIARNGKIVCHKAFAGPRDFRTRGHVGRATCCFVYSSTHRLLDSILTQFNILRK